MKLLKLSGLEMLIKGEGQIYDNKYICIHRQVVFISVDMGQAPVSGIAVFYIGITGNEYTVLFTCQEVTSLLIWLGNATNI